MNVKTQTREATSGIGSRVLHIATLATLMTLLASGSVFGQQTEQTRERQQETGEAVRLADRNAPVELYVRNNNWLDARIYAVREGTRYRLGTVTSFTIEKFELPTFASSAVEGVQILVLPIGSSTSHTTGGIQVFPGDVLALEVEEHLPLSAFYRAG